jgi:hypothetical protein
MLLVVRASNKMTAAKVSFTKTGSRSTRKP